MFSSRIIDNTSYCNIIKHSLLDDLYPYSVTNDTGLSIKYNTKDSKPIISKLSTLLALIDDPSPDYVWYPLIINNDDNISTKAISSFGAYTNSNPSLKSGRIGIENFYSFDPMFRSWNASGGSMSIDWILNNYRTPYYISYGIMCWYRAIPKEKEDVLSSFPNGSRLIHSSKPDNIYIKLDDTRLWSLDVNSVEIKDNSFDFLEQTDRCIVDITKLGDKFKLANFYKNLDSSSTAAKKINTLPDDIQLWVPDGDFFAYHDNESSKINCEKAGILSKSYVSSPLYKKYTSIYRILTLDEKRSFSTNLKKLRFYKKLAHILSTSPFINDYCVSFLDSEPIKTYIKEHITIEISDTQSEINSLKNLLYKISQYFQQNLDVSGLSVSLDREQSMFNFNNNLITNEAQLFNKLISKYGADLRLSSASTLSAKTNVLKFDNRGIVVTQVTDTFCDKSKSNTIIYNNQTINFADVVLKTNLEPNKSELIIGKTGADNTNQTKIPIIDFVKPRFDPNIAKFCPSLLNTDEKGTNSELAEENFTNYIYETSTVVRNPANVGATEPHCNAIIDLVAALIEDPIDRTYNNPGQLQQSTNVYLEQFLNFSWELISGPPGNFTKESEQSVDAEYFANLGNKVRFVTKYTGKFVFECILNSPFGTYKKQRTVYVVDGRVFADGTLPPIPNPNYGRYWDSISLSWKSPSVSSYDDVKHEFSPIILNKDNVFPLTSQMNKFAISNIAKVFWPIQTEFQVREGMGVTGDQLKTIHDSIFKLEKDYKFIFDYNYTLSENSSFSIQFNTQDTIVKVNSIFLERIRSDDEKCSQCTSLYIPTIRAKKAVVPVGNSTSPDGPTTFQDVINATRTNKHPDGFDLVEYTWDATVGKADGGSEYKSFEYPTISTKLAPKIKSYGGYSGKFINDIGINIPSHPRPENLGPSIISTDFFTFPAITGFKLDYQNTKDPTTYQFCYQKALNLNPTSGYIMPFTKGVFHPSSGWADHTSKTYQIHANRCGVLKFNPGARDSFSFIGPYLSKIESNKIDITDNKIEPKVFSSSITLKMAQHIQWDPLCQCGAVTPSKFTEQYNKNQKHKEYIDIDPNISSHGFRVLHGGKSKIWEAISTDNSPTVNDEFVTEYATDNYSYSFAVTGPSNLSNAIDGEDGRKHIRNPRVNSFGIKDIEIKLNFLNYVNTKNLVVWLEAEFCDTEQYDKFGKPDPTKIPQSPIKSGKQFVDQTFDYRINAGKWVQNTTLISGIHSTGVSDYLTHLTQLNSYNQLYGDYNDFYPEAKKFKLYLLNQEYIQNNDYNFSITFSDSSSKYNVVSDNNMFVQPVWNNTQPQSLSGVPSGYKVSNIQAYQTIIKSNDCVLPTLCPTGYSDRESCLYSNIVKFNKLNITANTLNKFVSSSLFKHNPAEFGPCDGASQQAEPDYTGSTTFTLKMMVLDEPDDMTPNDNLNSAQYFSGLETVENKVASTQVYNSLCSWELILHVGDAHKPIPRSIPSLYSYGSSDVLSLIDYGKDPSYPGYSFIADLSKYKHLLPLANINAPYNCIMDSNPCLLRPDDPTGQNAMLRPPAFPSWAILLILATVAGYAGLTGGSLVGALVGLGTTLTIMNIGYSALFNWFGEIAFLAGLSDAGRQIYLPNFAKYNFGSAEKLLINFRKPNGLWYCAESSFFKYHNTPILKPNKYKFVKIDRLTNSKNISKFPFSIVDSYDFLIDEKYVTKLSVPQRIADSIGNNTNGPPFIIDNTRINSGDIVDVTISGSNPTKTTRYVFPSKSGVAPATGVDAINSALNYLQNNSILSLNTLFDNSLINNIGSNKVIFIDNRIPYDILSINDNISLYVDNDLGACSGTTARILKKGLVFKNNRYGTVFSLDISASGSNTLSPPCDSNVYMIYKNETTVENKKNKQYNTWSFDYHKEFRHKLVPQLHDTVTHSLGSYGDISIFMQKNQLSNNIFHNQLETVNTIFNNRENDKIKFNKIKFVPTSGQFYPIGVTHSGSSYGFVYSEPDEVFDLKNDPAVYLETENEDTMKFLKDQVSLSNTNKNEFNNNGKFCFIKLIDASFSGIRSGELEIENDYIEYVPMAIVSDDDIKKLSDRLNLIESDQANSSLESAVGDKDRTNDIIRSSQLSYLYKHYHLLGDDNPECYVNDGSGKPKQKSNCYKLLIQNKVDQLIQEQQEIIQLLESQTYITANVSYTNQNGSVSSANGEIVFENDTHIGIKSTSQTTTISQDSIKSITKRHTSRSKLPSSDPRYLDPNILPKISGTITQNTDNSYTISYNQVNLDHYWINIDPKQSCFYDFAANPKILVSTEYACIPTNGFASNPRTDPFDHNVCPQFLNKSLELLGANPNNEEYVAIDSQIVGGEGTRASTYTYTIPPTKIDVEKALLQRQYPAITNWQTYTKERYFNINGDLTLDEFATDETTIRSKETYLIPVVSGSPLSTDLTADANTVPGLAACEASYGSPQGLGLLTSDGDRVGKTTRVENIINLNHTNNIEVMVKKIPRMLRGVDLLSTVYRYGSKDIYRQTEKTKPRIPFEIDLIGLNGTLNNSIYCWHCFQKDGNGFKAVENLPLFFRLQNEMIFRSFFGSVDKIENKTDVLVSQFPWEMIPYEYDT